MKKICLFLLMVCLLFSFSCTKEKAFTGGTVLTGDEIKEKQATLAAEIADEGKAKEVTHETVCYWVTGGSVYHLSKECSYLKEDSVLNEGTVAEAEIAELRRCSRCGK